jgi:hypothetical protein
MKVRNGFVSNSSSSSFMIPLSAITADQRNKIMDHIHEGQALGIMYSSEEDAWSITENAHAIEGYTSMDNFNMDEFLTKIGVPEELVHWERNG